MPVAIRSGIDFLQMELTVRFSNAHSCPMAQHFAASSLRGIDAAIVTKASMKRNVNEHALRVFALVLFSISCVTAQISCVTRTWRDRALQERPDRSTPELAFETLRAAIRLDDPMLGYRLLSEEMKEREQLTEILFITGWDAFFAKHPLARLMGNATVQSHEVRDNRVARVLAGVHGRTIETFWVRKDFFEIWHTDNPVPVDGFIPSIDSVTRRDPKDGSRLVATLQDERLLQIGPKPLRSIRIESEWKLAEFREIEADVKDPAKRNQ